MPSSSLFSPRQAVIQPNARWSGRASARSVRVVPATDGDRGAYRRRLGATLKRARSKLTDYTQADIASELDVDKDTVGRWERGDREPKAFDLHWMASLYGVDGDLFLNPPDSITELEVRIARLRREAQDAVAGLEQSRPFAGDTSARREPSRQRKPPRSPR